MATSTAHANNGILSFSPLIENGRETPDRAGRSAETANQPQWVSAPVLSAVRVVVAIVVEGTLVAAFLLLPWGNTCLFNNELGRWSSTNDSFAVILPCAILQMFRFGPSWSPPLVAFRATKTCSIRTIPVKLDLQEIVSSQANYSWRGLLTQDRWEYEIKRGHEASFPIHDDMTYHHYTIPPISLNRLRTLKISG